MNQLHRWLLRLLPRARRVQHGDEISAVFAEVLQQARVEGRSTVPIWIAEARGLARYGARERSRPPVMELRLAWRGLRARGWRAGIAIALLAVAIGANTVMFTVADALLFRPTTYADSHRVVEMVVERGDRFGPDTIRAATLDEWRQQTDLFEAVEAYLNRVVFLVGQGVPELIPTVDVTPGLTTLLGVRPAWGRPLTHEDSKQTAVMPVLIAEKLARARFGSPEAAVNQQLETSAEPLLVVGVMGASFRFPYGTQQIWRALDLRGPLARGYAGGFPIARLTGSATPETATALLLNRYARAGRKIVAGEGTPRLVTLDDSHRRRVGASTLWFLLAAAVCLLATACANIASLELATAVRRTRVWAIHRALGASRMALARIAAWEGLLLLAPALIGALAIAWIGVRAAETWLPEQLSLRSVNTFDVDLRAIAFMAIAAVATWLLTTLPTVLYASRRNNIDLLKTEARSSTSSGGARLRQMLTAAQIGIAVLLLTSGVIAARHYLAVLAIEKGFESHGLMQVMLTIPPQESANSAPAEARLREALATLPGVVGATPGMAPPSAGDSPMPMPVRVDGRPEPIELMVQRKWIHEDYFSVVGLPILEGRGFRRGEDDTALVVSDRFARRLGLSHRAVGARVQLHPRDQWRVIAGVVRHVPTQQELLAGPDDSVFQIYALRLPPPPPNPAAPPRRAQFSGAAYSVAALIVRADSSNRAADILSAVRRTVPGYAAKVTLAEDNYASFFSRVRLIRQITISFGVLGLLVSLAGVYGVMSYIVAGRQKEFGIRVALGAGRADIRALVFRGSMLMVLAGAAIGLAASVAVSRWAGATVFGIRTFEPPIFAGIGLLVASIALVAVWRPAASAAASDPVVLLRE